MHRSKRKRNVIIFSLVGVLLCMAVGYAAFQTRLEIKGSSKVTSNWDIKITNVTDGTPTGSAENTVKPSWTDLTASMEANLYDKGDSMEYDVTIENKGTIDAKLNDILTNLENSNSDAVIITFSGYTKGEVLKAGGSKIVHVKIEYNPKYEGGETSSEVEIDFEYTQNNNETENPDDKYLLTYDYATNGGESVELDQELLISGANIDLTNKATKEGWTFIGWNTDQDAEIGLTSYQMPHQNTTLYAIYSKDLKVTYEKGDNVNSIGKDSDRCTIYNNETSCEVTLPEINVTSDYIVSGWYCGEDRIGSPNDKYSINSDVTLTSIAIPDVISLEISTTSTTNSITVISKAEATTGIVKYEYSKDGGKTWEESTSSTYTFTGLTEGTTYDIMVKATSESNKETTKSKPTKTLSLTKPTFEEQDTSTGSSVTITYPEGCGSTLTCIYQKDNGQTVNVTTSKVEVPFTDSGNVVATVTDSTNTVSSSYTVNILPIIQSWTSDADTDFHNSAYREKISSIEFVDNKNIPSNAAASWDVSEKQNSSVMAWIINDTSNSSMYKLYIGGTGGVIANEDSSHLFQNFININSINFNNNYNTSNAINMSYMFSNCSSLTSLDVSDFDTKNVTDMGRMFMMWSDGDFISNNLTSIIFGNNFYTNNVTNMNSMFAGLSELQTLDVSNFDTSKVNNMLHMFMNCESLKSLDVSNFDTSHVTSMEYMFSGCKSLTILNLSNFNTGNVTSMLGMFRSCENLVNLNISSFNTSKVTTMGGMFQWCYKLSTLNLKSFNTKNVTNMNTMFYHCESLQQLDLSNFDTNNLIQMAYMFEGMTKLANLDISSFNTSKVTDMSYLFKLCTNLDNVNLNNFNTSNVTNMNQMFANTNFTSLDLSGFDTRKVTNMSQMFAYATKLKTIYVGTNWKTSDAITTNMFLGCGTSSVTIK